MGINSKEAVDDVSYQVKQTPLFKLTTDNVQLKEGDILPINKEYLSQKGYRDWYDNADDNLQRMQIAALDK
jgi:hypothetical protein